MTVHMLAAGTLLLALSGARARTTYCGGTLPKPADPLEHNGKAWPKICVDKEVGHIFGIADWGGDGAPGDSWTNPGVAHRRQILDTDLHAQGIVAREMRRRALVADPDLVLAAGDNFYPGGISRKCTNGTSASWQADRDITGQFVRYYMMMYSGPGLDGIPFLACLGNHDFGGMEFDDAWDQQIYRTWSPQFLTGPLWLMPAMYWSTTVQYEGFSVDLFFLESDFFDAHRPPIDASHNICGGGFGNWKKQTCYDIRPYTCEPFFHEMWRGSLDMLRKGLAESTAAWRIIVTHFPGPSVAPLVASMAHDIDLIFTGHTHYQLNGESAGIDWIISGGGGGVTSDAIPTEHGHDNAYGFTDITISKDEMLIELLSWGGPHPGQEMLFDKKVLKPKSREVPSEANDQSMLEAYLIWNNLTTLDTPISV